MPVSDQQFASWLIQEQHGRTVLAEMDYQYEDSGEPTTGTLYLADRAYIDNVEPRAYLDCIESVPNYSRALSGERLTSYSASVGSMTIANADGELDYLLDLAIDGSEIRFYVGDERWPVDDFRLIFSAYVVKIAAPSFKLLDVQLKDTGLLLNKGIGGDVKVGGTGPNAERWRQVNFGFLANIEYLVEDESLLTYVHSDSAAGLYVTAADYTQIVRDRGVSVAYGDNADGTITLGVSPDGGISGTVLVAASGSEEFRCVSDAFEHLVGARAGLTAIGKYAGPHATFEARPATGIPDWLHDEGGQDWQIGIHIKERRNLLDILDDLTDSGLCSWAITRLGEFTFLRLRPNDIASLGVASSVTIVEDDFDAGSFRLSHADPTYHRLQAYMSRNWHPSDDLAGVLDPDERGRLTRPGVFKIQDEAVGTAYYDIPQAYHLTMSESLPIDTLLSGHDEHEVFDLEILEQWLEIRRYMFLPWLETISGTFGLDFYDLELGDVVTLQIPRYGYDAGEPCQVIGINIRLTDAKVELKLLRRHEAAPAPVDWERETIEDEGSVADVAFDITPVRPIIVLGVPPLPGAGGMAGGGPGPEDGGGVVSFWLAYTPPPEEGCEYIFTEEIVATYASANYGPNIRFGGSSDILVTGADTNGVEVFRLITGLWDNAVYSNTTSSPSWVAVSNNAGTETQFAFISGFDGRYTTFMTVTIATGTPVLNVEIENHVTGSTFGAEYIDITTQFDVVVLSRCPGGEGDRTVMVRTNRSGWDDLVTVPGHVALDLAHATAVVSPALAPEAQQIIVLHDQAVTGDSEIGVYTLTDLSNATPTLTLAETITDIPTGGHTADSDIAISADSLVLAIGNVAASTVYIYYRSGGVGVYTYVCTFVDTLSTSPGTLGRALAVAEPSAGNYTVVIGVPDVTIGIAGDVGRVWVVCDVLSFSGSNELTTVGHEILGQAAVGGEAYGTSVDILPDATQFAFTSGPVQNTIEVWSLT